MLLLCVATVCLFIESPNALYRKSKSPITPVMLVILDLDGTLWDDGARVLHAETKEVLSYLKDKGHCLTLSTYNDEAHSVLTAGYVKDLMSMQ